jgi:hypothetical protein
MSRAELSNQFVTVCLETARKILDAVGDCEKSGPIVIDPQPVPPPKGAGCLAPGFDLHDMYRFPDAPAALAGARVLLGIALMALNSMPPDRMFALDETVA